MHTHMLKKADGKEKSRSGTRTTFPFQLHRLLTDANELGLSHVLAWDALGEKFTILSPNEFTQSILPSVFRQTKFSSFKRQLNAYGFVRDVRSSVDMDRLVYYHDKFRRDDPEACVELHRRRPGASGSPSNSMSLLEINTRRQNRDNEGSLSESDSSEVAAHQERINQLREQSINSQRIIQHEEQNDSVLDELASLLGYEDEDSGGIQGASDFEWDPNVEEEFDPD